MDPLKGGRGSTELFLECRHIKPNGLKCQALAIRGKHYCYFHRGLHGHAATPATEPEAPFKLPFLEDRSAIQIAIAQILEALGSGRLDQRHAGLYLYAIQLASMNVERRTDIISIRAVHSMTTTASGDELGPAILACPPLTVCEECDIRDTCKERPEKERAEKEEEESEDDD